MLREYITNIFEEYIVNNGEQYLTVYHGTQPKFIDSIKQDGLRDKDYRHGSHMLSSNFNTAVYYSKPDREGGDTIVIEFSIPYDKTNRWIGYPYLWMGHVMSDNSVWYSLKKPLPPEFITKVHTVPYVDWMKQKNTGFLKF